MNISLIYYNLIMYIIVLHFIFATNVTSFLVLFNKDRTKKIRLKV
jgi:hypothetical protein